MITCEGCHTENADGAQYCDECGASLLARRRTAPAHLLMQEGIKTMDKSEVRLPQAMASSPPPEGANGHERVAARPAISEAANAVAKNSAALSSGVTNLARAKLTIHRGRSAGKDFLLDEDEAYIGRWDADHGIFPDIDLDSDDPEAKISRRHARVTRHGEQYFIEDLGSTNGTFINRGRRLLPGDRQLLRDGDEIIIGKTFLRFHIVK